MKGEGEIMPEDVKSTPEVVETQTPPVEEVKPEDKKDEATNSDIKDTPEEKVEAPKEEEKKETEKEPEKEPENKEPENNNDDKIAGLEAEIERLKGELEQTKTNDNSKVLLDQANTLLSVQKNLVTEYEGILNGIIETKLAEVPENLKELVPANLNIQQKLDWIAKAEKSGIFKQANPDIEIGKPFNPNNVKQTVDTSKLSASSLIAMAYNNPKTKK